jgi:hypothetical protein
MFKIVHAGPGRDAVRIESSTPLTPDEFKRIAKDLVRPLLRARKIGYVAARPARDGERVETRWNGKETANTAHKGDWVVVNLSPAREVLRDRDGHENTYVVPAARFGELYERAEAAPDKAGDKAGDKVTGEEIYRAKGRVLALRLPGGFDIAAPWGERQQSPSGYLILNGEEVYGNNAETFEATYELLGP